MTAVSPHPGHVAVVGQGYVGLPTALAIASLGRQVVGFDSDEARVRLIESGQAPNHSVPASRLRDALDSGRYLPSASKAALEGFDTALICVPTPLLDGGPDLSAVIAASTTVGKYLSPGATVVLVSTTYPGTTQTIVAETLENASGLRAGTSFFLGYSPERMDPGNPLWTLDNTPRIVAGINSSSLDAVDRFFTAMSTPTVRVSSPAVGELAKLVENAFRFVNIAFVNEIADYCHRLGFSAHETLAAAATKPFGFMPFYPGPGVGGHCIPVDSLYLGWSSRTTPDAEISMINAAALVNARRPAVVVDRLTRALRARGVMSRRATIILLGLGYKRNSGDIRESPALEIARLLSKTGATVIACDPLVEHDTRALPVPLRPLDEELLARADAAIVVSDHDEFDWDLVVRSSRYIFDACHRLSGQHVEHL